MLPTITASIMIARVPGCGQGEMSHRVVETFPGGKVLSRHAERMKGKNPRPNEA
jgi:hypothetical protein